MLLDSPPIIAVADAATLAPRVDGVLLVVRAGKTRRDLAAKARKMLEQVRPISSALYSTDATLEGSAYSYYGKK